MTGHPIDRKQLCPCGSGRRYKHCCGRPGAGPAVGSIMAQALAAQRNGDLTAAAARYREALDLAPDQPDCLHMLGVALYSLSRYREAAQLIRKAGDLTGWRLPGIAHNFGLVLGARLACRNSGLGAGLRREYDRWLAEREQAQRPDYAPLVSIPIPSHNHAAYVGRALDSVFAQTYPRLELIVIDDGSTDGSPDLILDKLRDCPFPHRFLVRANRGAHHTLNEAVRLARGEFINPLNSDDLFDPSRIARMVEAIAQRGYEWGFALCACIDEAGRTIAPHPGRLAGRLAEAEDMVRSADTVGSALLADFNPAVSSGNLFFSRALFDRLSGFRHFKSAHDWDYCLRALWLAEPGFVPQPLYRYRWHRANTIRESPARNLSETIRVTADYHALALHQRPVNRFAPSRATMGLDYLARNLAAGHGAALAPATLKELDDEVTMMDQLAARKNGRARDAGLNVVGFFRGDFGLAESARALAETCRVGGITATFRDPDIPLGSRQSNRSMDALLSDDMPFSNTLFYLNPDQIRAIWHRYTDRGELEGQRLIGYWYWEIDAFPEKWRYALDLVDEIWVATDFVGNVMRRATDRPVTKIPHAIDIVLPRTYLRAEFSLPEDKFLFLFTFDFGSYAERKNPAAVIRAFQRAFPKTADNVGLVIKCAQGYKYPEKLAVLREYAAEDPRILLLDRLLSREAAYGLQSVCDAYVSLHRSEGLGLGMAECMAQGKPVIATAYSGNLEFMTADNSCLVDYSLIPVRRGDYIDYEPGWHWADADIDHAAYYMRRLLEDPVYRTRLSRRAKADMAARYGHEAVARALRGRLSTFSAQDRPGTPGTSPAS